MTILGMHPLQALALAVSVTGGLILIRLRIRATRRPTSLRKIVLPPVAMCSGFAMFAIPAMRIHPLWGLCAFGTGLLIFSFPLIVTTRLERREADIYVIRSKAFILIMAVLLAIRAMLHGVAEAYMTVTQTAALFYLLALGMILPWRLAMVSEFLRLRGADEAQRDDSPPTRQFF
ncbi:cytochrome c biogenesis protein CcdC [Paenibacillus sp. IB182496]|uniref:Cytochrome c biogenesis protein CcdC n=1 Tax=Paenibacillus sabuli TaxID=2772509 RepID=A0A927BRY9_9BACL|nr:cytochrome c biogenesis protein CcdC [Paenibacillus sabuli]MBD2844585.1 cytochrome c biogenesis protein CcdC [Paenibacillus sabuli]